MMIATFAVTILLISNQDDGDSPLEAKSFDGQVTIDVALDYLAYTPKGYEDSDDSYPLLIFLHGAGERGDDLEKVKMHGPPKLIESGEQFPFLVVAPQCPARSWWDVQTLSAWLDHLLKTYRVDESRVYLTGLSMGGFGSWAWAGEEPDRFAAVAPICGGGEPISARSMTDLPVWAFHGAKDQVVPLERTQAMIDALKQYGGDPKLTVYPDAGHDSWTETYDNQELYSWFLSHTRDEN